MQFCYYRHTLYITCEMSSLQNDLLNSYVAWSLTQSSLAAELRWLPWMEKTVTNMMALWLHQIAQNPHTINHTNRGEIPSFFFFMSFATSTLSLVSRGTFFRPELTKAPRSHRFPLVLRSPPGTRSWSLVVMLLGNLVTNSS